MANYPIKVLVDEQGQEFIPISSTDALLDPTGQNLDTILASKLETNSIIAGSGVTLNKDTTNHTVEINCNLPGASVIDNLTTTTAGQGSLDAHQGYVLNTTKINISDIVDNCTSTVSNKPLSAYQGYVLFNKFNNYALTSAIPTSTSQLTNNGSDGTHSFISNYSNGLDIVLKAQISGSEVDLEYGVPNSGGTAYIYSGVQKKLVSGTNIKTINGTSVLGSGNISILDLVYPIGSIYMSVNNVSPATFLGGTWEALQDRFLIGAGNNYAVNATGGNTSTGASSVANTGSTVLDVEHIPYGLLWVEGNQPGKVHQEINSLSTGGGAFGKMGRAITSGQGHSHTMEHTHSNLPPYLAVYMWKRTA